MPHHKAGAALAVRRHIESLFLPQPRASHVPIEHMKRRYSVEAGFDGKGRKLCDYEVRRLLQSGRDRERRHVDMRDPESVQQVAVDPVLTKRVPRMSFDQ